MGFGVKVGAEYTDNRKKRGSLRRGKASCSGKTWGAGPKEQKDSASATASGAVVRRVRRDEQVLESPARARMLAAAE